MDKKKLAAVDWWMSGGVEDDYTNSSGEQAILFIGDSIIAGSNNSTGRGPTPTPGTAYMWDNTSAVVEIGANDVVTAPANQGTMIPQFAIDYHSSQNRKVVAICRGSSGSEFYPNGDNNNWYSSGTLRAGAESAVTQTLSAIGVSRLKAVVVCLGTNDARAATSLVNVNLGVDSLVTWLSQYDCPILFIQIGRNETSPFNSRIYEIRKKIISVCDANDNCFIAGNMAVYQGASIFGADNLHPTQICNNFAGSGLSRWFSNPNLHKTTRAYVSCLFGDLSSYRKQLLNDFIIEQVNNGNFAKIEWLGWFKTNNDNDFCVDMTQKLLLLDNNAGVWSQNSHIGTNGTSSTFTYFHINDIVNISTTSDFIECAKVRTRGASSGLKLVFGNQRIALGENAATPAIAWNANNASGLDSSNTPDTAIIGGNTYAVARNGGTEYYIKNKTIIDTRSSTADAANATYPLLGARSISGTRGNYFEGTYEWMFVSKYSDLDFDSLVDGLENMADNW